MDNPLNIIESFERLQENQYREKTRVYDFLDVLKKMNIPYGQIRREFKDRHNFGKKTMIYLNRGAFDAARLPPRQWTSALPSLVEDLNRAYAVEIAEGKREPFTLTDIYPIEELNAIRQKWNNVPLGLSDQELDEYFLGGKELPEDKTSMILPAPEVSETKQGRKRQASSASQRC